MIEEITVGNKKKDFIDKVWYVYIQERERDIELINKCLWERLL